MARYVNLLILNKRFDDALQILTDRHFHSAEASDINLHVQWTDANILKGVSFLKEDNTDEAIEFLNRSMEFPENLESARDFLGKAYEASGDRNLAKEHYQRLVDFESTTGWGAGAWPEVAYFKALALSKI